MYKDFACRSEVQVIMFGVEMKRILHRVSSLNLKYVWIVRKGLCKGETEKEKLVFDYFSEF